MRKWIQTGGAGILAALLISLITALLTALPCFAASTGTVTATDVNIRQDASTSAGIVGTATQGETYPVGESKQDADGKTWYQITLTDGQTGYIREDFLTVEEDTAEAASTADTAEESPYSITKETGQDGNPVYYFVDSSNGLRLSLDEIAQMTNEVTALQAQLPTAGNSSRIAVIVLILLLILAGVFDVSLYTRLLNEARAGNRPRSVSTILKRSGSAAAGRKSAPARRPQRTREDRRDGAEMEEPRRRTLRPAAASEKPIMDFTFGDPVTEKKDAAPEEAEAKETEGEKKRAEERKPEEEKAGENDSAVPPQDTFAGKIRQQEDKKAGSRDDTPEEKKDMQPAAGMEAERGESLKNGPAIASFRAGEEADRAEDMTPGKIAADEEEVRKAEASKPQAKPHAINWAAEDELEEQVPDKGTEEKQ